MLLKQIEYFQCLWEMMFKQEKISFKKMHTRQIGYLKYKMKNNQFFEELKKKVKPILGEKGSHDFSHTERVYKYSYNDI